MNKWKKTLITLSLTASLFLAAGVFAACSDKKETEAADGIVNGSFEYDLDNNTIPGWTREGMAFQALGICEDNLEGVEAQGSRWFNGYKALITNKGTLTSLPFKLTGTGKIAFKLGAAKNGDKVYIEFCDAETDEPLSFRYDASSKPVNKATNTDFDGAYITTQLIRHIADLSDNLGKSIYIKITDEDANRSDKGYGYANLDDFRICETNEDVKKYVMERAAQLSRYEAPPFDDDDPTRTDILNGDFEEGLNHWKMTDEAFREHCIRDKNATYWGDRYFYNHGEHFYCGETSEAAKGSMRSTTFTLGGDGYITMMLGAGRSTDTFVEICLAESFAGEFADTAIATVKNTAFSNPERALMLIRHYVKLDERYLGRKMYINVVDQADGAFGFINVDDIRCSLTEREVLTLIAEQRAEAESYTHTGATYDDLAILRDYYASCDYPIEATLRILTPAKDVVTPAAEHVNLNDYLRETVIKYAGARITPVITRVTCDELIYRGGYNDFSLIPGLYHVGYEGTYDDEGEESRVDGSFRILVTEENQIANGGFETGDLLGWTVLTNGWAQENGRYKGVISATTYWDERLPYNQAGKYHLDGWNTGIEEGNSWTVRSSAFTLAGSGWISVRMGGNAARVRVYKKEGGVLIGDYAQELFSDSDFPNVNSGHWADMHTYAIDLSAHLGEELYIELCDVEIAGGWAHAFFDEVVTYYAEAPDWQHLSETVDNSSGQEPETVSFPWSLATNKLDAAE